MVVSHSATGHFQHLEPGNSGGEDVGAKLSRRVSISDASLDD